MRLAEPQQPPDTDPVVTPTGLPMTTTQPMESALRNPMQSSTSREGINRLADYSTNYDFPPGHIPSRAEHRSSKQARSHASTKRPCATSAGSVWI
ncbi:hypothetical protein MTO96_012596 [Rhipicephalus appendiculatus]